ncbi:capsule biosynthesis GfcC family protein [Metapseudomonas boanensis]|uniref:Capsule biosynthesis GfcC family protein n=1 Tax=Metapseudomonas boanensis TaxID=2822138 RepID=A0ABS5XDP1_9GAMM|nr:capsule biosynthesis GfcC family protein [Pseudomonas boanensis]MBT8765780.1 capsule biosynthesis GfcC family protein [Pseudomonas boanensis]
MSFPPSWLLLCSALFVCAASAAPTVTVEGDAAEPGPYTVSAKTRLHDVLLPAQVSPKAYLLGAAWLHGPLREEQVRLKLGVLFDLATLERNALLDDRLALAELATRLSAKVQAMPVTGRRVAELDPVKVELNREHNPVLSAGDRLLYPPRPDFVVVEGAVQAECRLPFVPFLPARDYLDACPRHAEADPDELFVVQPDGRVQRQGVALWNRTEAPAPAPGARIYVPVRSAGQGEPTPDLNAEFAAFIATQPLEVAP